MNIFDISKQFFIVMDKVGYEEVVVFEPNEGTIIAQTMLSEDQYEFSVDTQAELWDNGKFYVKSVEGEDVPFIAYRNVDWAKDMPATNWDNDAIQFPRLIAEIAATQDKLDMTALCDSMDLEIHEVNQLFDRADTAWEEIKSKT